MRTASAENFVAALLAIESLLARTVRSRYSLATLQVYGPKVRTALATLRKCFLMLRRDYPDDRFPRVAFQLATIEPLMARLVEVFPSDTREMLRMAEEIEFKVNSDLAAELDAPESNPSLSSATPFLPADLIADRHGVLQKILWEANRCYDAACYNACAAMMRRLVESLIIETFERQGVAEKIKVDGEYVEFGALIGKAAAEPALRLTRNTKRVLPALKFLGDLGAHNRMALVRKDDVDRWHEALRAGIEELTRSL